MPGLPLTRQDIEAKRLVAPAVSVIVNELRKRPSWQQDQPFAVPSEIWTAARDEMKAIMKKRGFPLGVSKAVGVENFLVLGTAIVPLSS